MDWQFGVTIGILVYMAFVFDFFGFLARDELWLRLLMLAASALYLVYYYYVAETPLWDAIYTNAALAAANLLMIVVVLLERTTFSMSQETAELFRRFEMLSPGQFRRLLKDADDIEATTPTTLTRAGDTVERLYYIIDGNIRFERDGETAQIQSGVFIGEIAFLTGNAASATITVDPGTRYLQWDAASLRRAMRKSPKLNVALSAQFNTDLVGKVVSSVPVFANPSRGG
ncbi:MAG: cyclic nucleotide-binding domain-containing protein [Pseudomonadota bacterium]|nr:cyclic nucleotide-binding domain-containing protein [Pseudomonadota bacterium]